MDLDKLDTLVLSGGGFRGINLLGAIEYIKSQEITKNIKRYIGTSIGGMLSIFLSLGFTPTEIFDILYSIDLTKLLDIDIKKLFTHFGIDSGHLVLDLLQSKLIQKFGESAKNMTLLDHYHQTGKEVVLVTCCLNTREPVYLSHVTFPNLHVLHAIRMSMSVPFFYTTVQWNGKYYVDGGIIDNYPIKYALKYSENVLGIKLAAEKKKSDDYTNIESIEDYISALFECMQKKFDGHDTKGYEHQSVVITSTISQLDFDLSNEIKQQLFDSGFSQMKEWCKTHSSASVIESGSSVVETGVSDASVVESSSTSTNPSELSDDTSEVSDESNDNIN